MHAHQLQRQYNFAPHNIVAMDETAVWNNMVSETTVKTMALKMTQWNLLGLKKSVFVCLAAQLDGTTLKPFILFGAAKQSRNHYIMNINESTEWRISRTI